MKHASKGFTLIEIMIVVAIIAILAAIAIPNFITYRKTSQMNACKANMKAIVAACEAYSMKAGNQPSDATSFASLTSTDRGAFLKKTPKCPLGGTAEYTISYVNGIYSVTCPNANADGSGYAHVMD